MTLPVIPSEEYQAHRSRRFETRVQEAAAPFEEEERYEAQTAQSSAQFLGRVEQLASGFEQQETERGSADFLARVERLAAPFEETERAAPSVGAPPVGGGDDPLERAFGDLGPEVVERMRRIRQLESGGRADAHKNDAIEDSRGPLQINARAHPQLAAKYDLFDPDQNARAAREVYDAQGFGAWHNANQQLGPTPTQELTKTGPRPAPATDKATGRVEAVGQFEQGLPDEEAFAACGPVAALAFAQQTGRNPTLDEARALAKRVGWTAEGGMNGVANQKALLDRMGVASRLDTDVDFGEVAQDASTGNPVIVSTAKHYYYVNGYDPKTGRFHVGKTGLARKGGSAWMSAAEIAHLDGGINGALFVDNPRTPEPSVAAQDAQQTTLSGEAAPGGTPEPSDQPAPETPWYARADAEPPGAVPSGVAALEQEGRRFGPQDVPGLPTALRPELRPPEEGEGPLAALEKLGAVSDVPNRVGLAVAEAVLSGRDPAQAILETARAGGRAPKGEDVLAAAGMPEGDLRRTIGRAIDFGADWRNLIPGLSLTGKGAVARNVVAEPLGAVVGGEIGGEIGERVGGPQGRQIGETVGSLGGAVGAGMRYEQIASDPATRRLGITGGDGTPEPKTPRVPLWARPIEQPVPLEGFTPPPVAALDDVAAAPLPSGRSPAGAGAPRVPAVGESALAPVERALARPEEPALARLKGAADRLIRESYDRNYPLRELDDLAGNAATRGAHASAQVVSGAIAAGEDNVRRHVMPILDGLGPEAKHLQRYWVLRASEDVVARNPHAKLPGGIEGPGGVVRGVEALKRELGPERFAKIEESATKLWQMNDELRLKPLLDEGILDRRAYVDLKNANPHYLPFHRYEYAVDSASHLLPGGGSLSVSGAGLGKRTEGGSTLALDQPVARWMADMINVQQVASRNRAARAIVEALQAAEKNTGQRLVTVADGTKVAGEWVTKSTQERGVIRYFDPAEPGVQKVANVPEIYATVAKGLEAEPANMFMRLMNAAAMPLRMGATTLSLAFLPRNIARDMQSVYVKEGIKLWSPELLAGWKAAIAKNSDFSAAARAGALQSGLLESRRTEDVLKRAQELRGITVSTPKDAVLLLPRLLGTAVSPLMRLNEIAEQAPRLATFIKAMNEGATELEAAVRARDVTVDFSKSGNFVRMMNQMVPFLNARVQGSANTARLFTTNPAQASARVVAPAAFLSTAAYLWNQRFETAETIPSYEWDRNWIFIMGEGTQNPDPRTPDKPPERFPIYMRIPKGDGSSTASAPVELMLRLAFAQGDRSVVEHIIQAAGAATRGLSPIEPTGSGALSLVMPPVAATGAGIQSNYDSFRGRPIVPEGEKDRAPEEQYGPETSSTAVALGRQFGVSPRMLDYAIKSYTGGAGQQALWLLDLALGAVGYDPAAPGEARLRTPTATERLARSPGVSGVLGAANTEQRAAGRDHFQKAVLETQRALADLPDMRRLGVRLGPVSDAVESTVLTAEERIAYQRRSAEIAADMLDRAQAGGRYENADDDRKREILQDALSKARATAAKEILREIPPDERRERRRAS